MILFRQYSLYISLLVILIFSGCGSKSSSQDLRVDGRFEDWSGLSPAYSDQTGDGDGIDIGRVWISNDDRRFFLRFELGEEISLQSGNKLALYLDTDNDPSTGHPVNGIGADLLWRFGDRSGRFYNEVVISRLMPMTWGWQLRPLLHHRSLRLNSLLLPEKVSDQPYSLENRSGGSSVMKGAHPVTLLRIPAPARRMFLKRGGFLLIK